MRPCVHVPELNGTGHVRVDFGLDVLFDVLCYLVGDCDGLFFDGVCMLRHKLQRVLLCGLNQTVHSVFVIDKIYIFRMDDQEQERDACSVIVPQRPVRYYVKYPFLIFENPDMKMSLALSKVRFSYVLPEGRVIVYDDNNRIQVEFDDPADVYLMVTYVRKCTVSP
jgi:hypothetical protein